MENKELKRLKAKMAPADWDTMVQQAIGGDEDWATDMMEEVQEGILHNSAGYTAGFHDVMRLFNRSELETMIKEWVACSTDDFRMLLKE